jgi:transposase
VRARIVLLAADCVAHAEIARWFSISRQTVINWRARYVAADIPGLFDEDRSGRPRTPGPRQPDLGHAGAATEEIWRRHRRNTVSHTGVSGCWLSI